MGRQNVWSQRLVAGFCSLLLALVGFAVIGASPTSAATVTASVAVGSYPDAVGVDTYNECVYVANENSSTVSVINEANNTVTATIPGFSDPEGVGVDPSTDMNMIYVANAGSGTVSVINGATNTITGTAITVGSDPEGVGVDPTTEMIYVANEGSGNVSVINEATDTVVATVTVGTNPVGVGVDTSSDMIYVANAGSGNVSVINGATNALAATVNVGSDPVGVAVDSSTHDVYVANENSDTVSVINEANNNNTVSAIIPVGSNPAGVAVDPSTDTIYVGNASANNYVWEINGTTNAVTATITVGLYPDSVAVDTSTHKVYVANAGSNTVSVITPAGTTPSLTIVGPGTGSSGSAIALTSIISVLGSGTIPTGTITFTVFGPQATAPTVCTTGGTQVSTVTVSGNGSYETSSSYTPPSAGNYWWYVSYSGDANNNATASTCGGAMSVTIVAQGSSTVTWVTPSAITYGTALSATQLDATSAVAGTYTYAPAAGTVLVAGKSTLTVTFTPTDSTDYASSTASVLLTVNPAPLTITAASTKMAFGAKPPAVTAKYSGFVNGNSASSLSKKPKCVTKATKTTPVGTHARENTCSGAVDANYAIRYVAGSVKVVGPVILIKANTTTITLSKNTNATLACSLAACHGTMSLTERKGTSTIAFGGTSYAIGVGKSANVTITLNAVGRLALASASPKHPFQATLKVTVKGGTTRTATVKVD